MKSIAILIGCLSLLYLSCKKNADATLPDFSFRVGEKVVLSAAQAGILKPDDLKITFLSVPVENRCPKNVMCVWPGYAVAAFRFEKGSQSITDSLSTMVLPEQQLFDTVHVFGRTVRLLKLTPYPAESPNTIPQEDYKAEIIVE